MKMLAPLVLAAALGASFAHANSGLADRANEARSYPNKTESTQERATCEMHGNMHCKMMNENAKTVSMCKEGQQESDV